MDVRSWLRRVRYRRVSTAQARLLTDIRGREPLKWPQVAQLLVAARAGDRLAYRQLVEDHLELVTVFSIRYAPKGVRSPDATQEGMLVLQALIDDHACEDPAIPLANAIRARMMELPGHGQTSVE